VVEIEKSIFAEIQGDLDKIVSQVKQDAASHPTLSSKKDLEKQPLLATLLLFAAKFGEYNFEKLFPTGVALELIELAVEEHYPLKFREAGEESKEKAEEKRKRGKRKGESEEDSEFSQNLSLITGDYYYSRAIMLVAGLRDVAVIRVLAESVATIAEAITYPLPKEGSPETLYPQYLNWIEKITSLYNASPQLGVYLSKVPPEAGEVLQNFGKAIGGYVYVNSYMKEVEEKIFKQLQQEFSNRLKQSLEAISGLGFEVGEVPTLSES
jgi:recombination DNA repair RAD52 pathway protein